MVVYGPRDAAVTRAVNEDGSDGAMTVTLVLAGVQMDSSGSGGKWSVVLNGMMDVT